MTQKSQKTLDEQFHDVSIAFAESRDFTLHCFTRLDAKFTGLDAKVTHLEAKVTGLDAKVATLATTMDRRFTRNELLLTEILNEVRGLSRRP